MNLVKPLAIAIATSALLAVAGCGQDKAPEPTPPPSDQPADKQAGDQAADTAADIPDDDLPVMTDFEDEADRDITQDNYLQELEAMEKEIGEDSAE